MYKLWKVIPKTLPDENSAHHFVTNENIPSLIQLVTSSPPSEWDIPDHLGRTPLTLAATAGNSEIVRLLIKYGADVNADYLGRTPLWCAIHNWHPECIPTLMECIHLLLDNGANVNGSEDSATSPIWEAVYRNAKEIFHLLLRRKPILERVQINNQLKSNPLEIAIAHDLAGIFIELVAAGANPQVVLRDSCMRATTLPSPSWAYLKVLREAGLQYDPWKDREARLDPQVFELFVTPLSLKSQCRISIRRALKDPSHIDLLLLPTVLIHFLAFSDMRKLLQAEDW